MQTSHRSNEDFTNKYTNKLLFKASNMHLKQNETISPIRKKSMIESNLVSLNNYETDQWTDRFQRIREKNKSCMDLPDEAEMIQQNSSQFLVLSQSLKLIMQNIEKKLKNFKFAKENDHNSCASTIAKMKCFCIDNCCFDFYRCTDLILLKYMIYLLIQELNQKRSEIVQQTNEPQQQIFKNLIKDAIAIMHETVEEMKNKHDRNSNVDQLNKQIRKMQQAIGIPNFDCFTTPPSNLKKSDLIFKPQSATQKRETNVSSPSINSQKIIQFQIDELQMKNEQVQKLLVKVKDQEQQIKILNQQISETNLSLQISQKSLYNKEQELKDMYRKTDKLLETTSQAVKDKDQYQHYYMNIKQEHDQLKTLFDDLQKSNQSIIQEFHTLKQSQDDSMSRSKIKEDEEKIQLQQKLKEKSKLLKQISEEGQQLGTQLKEVSVKIMQMSPESLPQPLQQLQRDLYLKESSINQKINNMHLAQIDRGKERKLITNHMIDEVQLYRTHSDFMTMLLIQSEVIEKFIN